jgi:hypothetical protein
MEKLEKIKECSYKIFSKELLNKFNNIIFIYTPPKVGSTTLVSSLRLCLSNNYLITHIHDENMLNVLIGFDSTNSITINEIIEFYSIIGKNVYVIDVYRNPIERKMSEYFEIIANFHFNNIENNMNKYKSDVLIQRFNKIFPFIGEGDYYFEKYPIIVPEKFNFDSKCLVIKKNNINYIKLRLQDSPLWGLILSSIFQTEIIIIKDYDTQNKIIGEVYNKFKYNYKIPSNYLENIKNCPFFNYYNTDKEKFDYIKSWENKQTNEFVPFNIDEYKLYEQITKENQFYNIIQRQHYLDFGCICKSCFVKRKQIINKIKKGEQNINLKVIHEEVVQEKKIKKVNAITKICKQIQNINKNSVHKTSSVNLKINI